MTIVNGVKQSGYYHHCKWGKTGMCIITIVNGVKQGGVLSTL